jgi:hypothetical protein
MMPVHFALPVPKVYFSHLAHCFLPVRCNHGLIVPEPTFVPERFAQHFLKEPEHFSQHFGLSERFFLSFQAESSHALSCF